MDVGTDPCAKWSRGSRIIKEKQYSGATSRISGRILKVLTLVLALVSVSRSAENSTILLPMNKNYSSLFKQSAAYEGYFRSWRTDNSGLFGEDEKGFARVEFFTKGLEEHQWIRVTLAESDFLDSKVFICEADFKNATVDTNKFLISVSISDQLREAVHTEQRVTVVSKRVIEEHDLSMSLTFKIPKEQKVREGDVFEQRAVITIELESKQLGIKAVADVRKGMFVVGWHSEKLTVVQGISHVLGFILLSTISAVSYLWAIEKSKKTEIDLAQGAISWVSVFWINFHFYYLVVRYVTFGNIWTKCCYFFIIGGLMIQIGLSGWMLFSVTKKLENFNHSGKDFNLIWTITYSLFSLLLIFLQETILDSWLYELKISLFYAYPVYEVIFISKYAATSKENYFLIGQNIFIPLHTILVVWIFHGSEFPTIQFKKRTEIMYWATILCTIGSIIIFCQSIFGQKHTNRPYLQLTNSPMNNQQATMHYTQHQIPPQSPTGPTNNTVGQHPPSPNHKYFPQISFFPGSNEPTPQQAAHVPVVFPYPNETGNPPNFVHIPVQPAPQSPREGIQPKTRITVWNDFSNNSAGSPRVPQPDKLTQIGNNSH